MTHRRAAAAALLLACTLLACDDGGSPTVEDAGTDTTGAAPAGDSSTTATSASPTGTTAPDVVLADGRLTIPGANIGAVDLTRLPVGDELTSTTPQVGYLNLCDGFGDPNAGGAQVQGPWFNGDGTYDLTAKVFVLGEVPWDDAAFTVTVDGADRVLTGNDLPVDHTTGEFPIAADDPAAEFDRNPSGIAANDYVVTIPANPEAASAPGCVRGEAGFLLSGVILNSPVDAIGRDAVAWESQDHCSGHPNQAGYHYHSVSPCVPDEGTGHSPLVGYALDGFGIYGHRGEDGEVITNADLDECHGHTHEIEWDGELVELYHYHATWEFPYAVGCFHGTNSFQGPPL